MTPKTTHRALLTIPRQELARLLGVDELIGVTYDAKRDAFELAIADQRAGVAPESGFAFNLSHHLVERRGSMGEELEGPRFVVEWRTDEITRTRPGQR